MMTAQKPRRTWAACSRGILAGLALAVLLVSCSTEDRRQGSGSSASAGAAAKASGSSSSASAEPVADRSEPLAKRVNYPVKGEGDPSQNWGDLYLPAGKHSAKSVPLVVLIHGGAWQSSIGAEDFNDYAHALVDRGMAVYNIEYRRVGSGGGWPTTFTDVAAAMDYVPELSKKHPEFTTDDELVVGHSAGAQLAMWAGTRDSKQEHELGAHPRFVPTRVISLAGPLDLTYAATHGDANIVAALGGTPDQIAARYSDVDPIQNIDSSLPVVAVHGTADEVVSPENSRRYIDAVKQAGGRGSLHLMDGDSHGSLIEADSAHFSQILDVIDKTADADVGDVGKPKGV